MSEKQKNEIYHNQLIKKEAIVPYKIIVPYIYYGMYGMVYIYVYILSLHQIHIFFFKHLIT